jgi:16S rRNA U516 pseudouridylate synthase RsuA-like enzyme
MGYEVEALDRVMFAGLTKKNIKRGHWRILTELEVNNLKCYKITRAQLKRSFLFFNSVF